MGDITRSTFQSNKHYTSVRMQQGRLQLDSDWNEQADIQNYLRRAQVTDMIGSGSGASKVDPITGKPATTNFQPRRIVATSASSNQGDNGQGESNQETQDGQGENNQDAQADQTVTYDAVDIALQSGHFYTNGVLCELTPGTPFLVRPSKRQDDNAAHRSQDLDVLLSMTIDGRSLQVGDWLVPVSTEESGNATNPPATNPPATNPPATNPPATNPPAINPPATTDPENRQEPDDIEGWQIKAIDPKSRKITVIGFSKNFSDQNFIEVRRILTYGSQPDFPTQNPPDDINSLTEGLYMAYLDVWQQDVTAVDDPSIREVALNVPDTTTRTRTVWQLKFLSVPELTKSENSNAVGPESPPQEWEDFLKENRNRKPLLNAKFCRTQQGTGSTANATTITNRLENHLYRVEIHYDTPNAGSKDQDVEASTRKPVSFKWSRENGSVVSAIDRIDGGDTIRICKTNQSAWEDSIAGQWIEILTDEQELKNQPGVMVPLRRVVDTKIEFDAASIVDGPIPGHASKVRRWDHTQAKAPNGSIPIQSVIKDQNEQVQQAKWIELEKGINVRFGTDDEPFQQGDYRTGDYWLIASRAANNDIDWPTDQAGNDVTLVEGENDAESNPIPQLPHGIEHNYALMAIVEVGDSQQITQVRDQRVLFPPLLRALDRAGGTITGNLMVEQTTTTKDLKVTGRFAAETFRGKNFEIALNPLTDSMSNYATIQAVEEGNNQRVEFTASADTNFIFKDGNVGIGVLNPQNSLAVDGTISGTAISGTTISGTEILKNGQPVALQSALNEHVSDRDNPHAVTAAQIDGNNNAIVAQINAGSGVILAGQIDPAIARMAAVNAVQNNLNSHTNNKNNPHEVTAAQIDGNNGAIVAQVNASNGVISAGKIDVAIARLTAVESVQTNLDNHINSSNNPHNVTAQQIDGSNDAIVSQINAGDGIIDPKNIDPRIVRRSQFNEHRNDKDNPHEVTAQQVNALPVSGGTLRGNLVIDDGDRNFSPPNRFPLAVNGGVYAREVSSNNIEQLSSQTLKQNIDQLSSQEVTEILKQLQPVKFVYKEDQTQDLRAGFLAEETPDLLTSQDKKAIKILDVVAVLTRSLKDHQQTITDLSDLVQDQRQDIARLQDKVRELEQSSSPRVQSSTPNRHGLNALSSGSGSSDALHFADDSLSLNPPFDPEDGYDFDNADGLLTDEKSARVPDRYRPRHPPRHPPKWTQWRIVRLMRSLYLWLSRHVFGKFMPRHSRRRRPRLQRDRYD